MRVLREVVYAEGIDVLGASVVRRVPQEWEGRIVMRVCLIIPPSPFLLDERVFMSLGVLRVAAVLEREGIEVEVLDLSGVENFEEVAGEYGRGEESCRVIGITATTPQLPAAVKVAEAIRSGMRGSERIILGGPHVTLVNAAAKRGIARACSAFGKLLDSFDVLVAGDGEVAIHHAVKSSWPRLIDADNPKSEMFLTNQTLSELPFPARHLVDVESYHYSIDGAKATSLIAQLGCPFGCGFCGGRMSPSLRKIRMRTVESILAEMRHLHETYGFTGFMFYDDELNVNPQMVPMMEAIHGLSQNLGVEFKLRGFVKAELFNERQAESMYRAGFRWLLTGFESGSPRILKNIQKKATREENTRAVDIAHSHGLKVKALMSIGHPGESRESVEETKDWLLEVKPEDFDVTIITTYPGTPYYDGAVECGEEWRYEINGDALYAAEVDYTKVADYYKGDPNDGYVSYVRTDFLTAEQLVAERNRVESEVRETLGIPFNPSVAAKKYEHSMGQLPQMVLRQKQ